MTKRKAMTSVRRKRILSAYNGRCAIEGCETPQDRLELDHRQALARGGDDSDENIQPLCRAHHSAKTFGIKHRRLGTDNFEAKKTRRLAGELKPRIKRKIQSRGFDKRWKKKMDGTVVAR